MNPKDRAGAAKPNLSILPFAPLYEAIPAIYEGRRKYGYWNWRGEQISETIYADAAIRHLMQFISGEDVDQDSGVHHISKAIAGLLVVRDAMLHGTSIDDRSIEQNLNIPGIMEKLADIDSKYPDPVDAEIEAEMVPLEVSIGDRLICENGEIVTVRPTFTRWANRELILVGNGRDPVQVLDKYGVAIKVLDKYGVATTADPLEGGWSVVGRAEDE